MTRHMRYRLSGVLGALLCSVAMAQDPPSQRVTIDIDEPALHKALIQFTKQAGFQLIFPEAGKVAELPAPRVSGTFTPQAALDLLLKNSGLHYEFLTPQAIAIYVDKHSSPVSAAPAHTSPSGGMRLAEADKTTHVARNSGQPQAQAQEQAPAATGSEDNLQEIIVTAQKRDERLQDVPVPVTVLSAAALVDANQLRLQDYATEVPGLNVTTRTASAQALTLRGITTGGSSNPTVGIMIDDVLFGASTNLGGGGIIPDIDPGDLARIEVLRGPQGTLYGASSLGGLIKYVTTDPSTGGYSGRIEGGLSTVHNGDDLGYNVRGAANIPLGETLAARVSGFTRTEPGYIDNPVLNKEGVNKQDVVGGRVSALWKPSDVVSLKINALYQDYQSDGNNDAAVLSTLGELEQDYIPNIGAYDRKIQAYSAILKASFAGMELTSLSGYNINRLDDSLDYTSLLGNAIQTQFGVRGARLTYDVTAKKFSQEVRLASATGAKFEWLLGGFYTHEDSVYAQKILAENPVTGAIVGTNLSLSVPSTLSDVAAFADLTYHFTDRFDVQIGGRQSHITYAATSAPNPRITTKADAFTYLFTPRFKISSDLTVYARLASGYRPGGSNATFFLDNSVPQDFEPDKTQNYELGLKGDFLDRKLFVDASVYHITWKDIQIPLLSPLGFAYNGNGGKAKSEGVELSVRLKPVQGLTLAAWVAYDDAVLDQDFPPRPAYGLTGDRLPNSSRRSGSFSVDDEFVIGGMTAFVGGTVAYVGDRIGIFGATPLRQVYPAYSKVDARAGLRFNNSTTVNLFASNLTDKRGVLNGGVGYVPTYAYQYLRPRTIGLSVVKTF